MSADLAVLGLSIDSAPAVKAAADLDKLASSAKAAGQAADTVSAGVSKATNSVKEMERAAQIAAVGFKAVQTGAAAGAREVQELGEHADQLRAKLNPLGAAQEKLAQQVGLYARLAATGTISTKEQILAIDLAQRAFNSHTQAVTAGTAAVHAHGAATQSAYASMQEAGHVVRAMTGVILAGGSPLQAFEFEMTRIAAIAGGPGGLSVLLQSATNQVKGFGGVALAAANPLTAFGAGLAIVAAAAYKYELAQERMQRAVEGTGRAAGVSRSQLDALAASGARAANINLSEGRSLAADYAQAGVSGDIIGRAIGDAPRFARFTGQDTGEAGSTLAEALKDPERGAQSLNAIFGNLNDKLATTISDYEAQGQHAEAQRTLFDAFEKSLKATTDQTWALGDALREGKRWGGALFDGLGKAANNFLGGNDSAEDRLKYYKSILPNTFNSPLAVGNLSTVYVKQQIDQANREIIDRSKPGADPAAKARDAEADELSKKIGPLVRSLIPEMAKAQSATNTLTLLRGAMADPLVISKLGGGIGAPQLAQAYGREAVTAANADPLARMTQDNQIALSSINAVTLAERAAVDARRAELQVLRETGDVTRASVAARIAENQAIAASNRQADLNLMQARQQAAMVGMTPYEKGKQEILNKYDSADGILARSSTSQIEAAMRPVQNDLVQAGNMVATTLRDIAQKIAASNIMPLPTGGSIVGLRAAAQAASNPFGALPSPSTFDSGGGNNASAMIAKLVAAGYSPAAAAGFVGGMTGESGAGLNPLAVNPASGAVGISQWLSSDRVAGLKAMPNWQSFGTQSDFVLQELLHGEGRAGQMLRNATTVQGGLAANLAYERPAASEITSSYDKRLANGLSLAGGGLPAAVPNTGYETNKTARATELAAYDRQSQIGPILDANNAILAQTKSLEAQKSSFLLSTGAIAEATEKQRLLTQFEQQHIPVDAKLAQQINATAQQYGAAAQAADDFAKHQQAVIATLDQVRGASKDALGGLATDLAHGSTLAEALTNAIGRLEDRLINNLTDSFVDSLLGKSGTNGSGSLFGSAIAGATSSATTAGGGLLGSLLGGVGHLFGFADGGVMTSDGALPLHKYASGGVASSPQLAMFGEGRGPEAYVPLADGRSIPVSMKGGGAPANNNTTPVSITHAPTINVPEGFTKEQTLALMDQSQKRMARNILPILSNAQRRFA